VQFEEPNLEEEKILRLDIWFLSLIFIFASASGGAFAQTASDQKSKMEQTSEKKMKSSEDPSSPAMQQAAARQADCKKQAKAKKLYGSDRKKFMVDCAK
jgi:psiF repeat